MIQVGIDKIGFYLPQYYVSLEDIAVRNGVNPEKFHTGIGQERFAIAPHDEDIVTLAANAAEPILNSDDKDAIDTVLLATESGIDQSKAAAIYVHKLLDLPPNCRALELKQACYSATAGLQMACDYVARKPRRKVLLLASDLARYDLYSAAEATQGCAAVAMLITANPRIASRGEISGHYTEDIMDFWRPNARDTPLLDGKFSTMAYLHAAEEAFKDYQRQGGLEFTEFTQYCYHLPFSRMAIKAHRRLSRLNRIAHEAARLEPGLVYNREIGNSYTAALYLSLCSALDNRDDLGGKNIAMLSYGSGCVAEFFHLTVSRDYREMRQKVRHQHLLEARSALSSAAYETFWHRPDLGDIENLTLPRYSNGRFRFTGIDGYQRRYARQ